MIGTILGIFVVIATGNFMGDEGLADTDPFNHAFGDNFLFVPIIELIFYR